MIPYSVMFAGLGPFAFGPLAVGLSALGVPLLAAFGICGAAYLVGIVLLVRRDVRNGW